MQKIKSLIRQMKIKYLGEYDETDEYIYTNKRHFIPNRVRKLLRLKQIMPDRRKKRFGRIKAHLFNYISLPMVFITCALVFGIMHNRDIIYVFLTTSLYLNGLIVSLGIFGILRVYYNSYLLFKAASFLRQLEKISEQDTVTRHHVEKLRHDLEKRAELLNTIYMTEVLDHIEEFGFLNIKDGQARFIKSKLGYRVTHNRKGVNFIAGILVMLGLLGTFLGLLKTIDAVGEALNSMSNIGGDNGEVGMEEMSSFIGSLAAPLQGMGLAFSSSLFGLSGSLLIGFFLHLAGTPQNYFMENAARWLDDRIVKFDPRELTKKAKKDDQNTEGKPQQTKEQPRATDNDLKDWLTGYVYLSTQTNKKLADLSESIAQAGNNVSDVSDDLKVISGQQNSLINATHALGGSFNSIVEQAGDINVRIQDIQDLSHTMNSAMTSIDLSNRDISGSIGSLTETAQNITIIASEVSRSNATIEQTIPNLAAAVEKVSSSISEMTNLNAGIGETLPNLTSTMQNINTSINEVERSSTKIEQALPNVSESLGMMRNEHQTYARALYTELNHINKGQGEMAVIGEQSNDNAQLVLQRIEATLSMIEQSNQALVKVLSSNSTSFAKPKSTPFSLFRKKRKNQNVDYNNGEE